MTTMYFRIEWLALCLLLLLSMAARSAAQKSPVERDADARLTLALYPYRPLTAADTVGEKTVHQGTNPQILWVTDVRWPTLTVYLPSKEKATGTAVVICPGGGYSGEAMDLEGYDIAKRFLAYGIAGIVLKYRLPTPEMDRAEMPWPIQDGMQAIRLVRDHAREWGIDPRKVGIMGFSAGGHLASGVATHFDAGQPHSPDRAARLSSRPDFVILGYPVITFHGPYAHAGSRDNLLGATPDPKLVTLYSNDEQVTAQTPPTFLVQAEDDPGEHPEQRPVLGSAKTGAAFHMSFCGSKPAVTALAWESTAASLLSGRSAASLG